MNRIFTLDARLDAILFGVKVKRIVNPWTKKGLSSVEVMQDSGASANVRMVKHDAIGKRLPKNKESWEISQLTTPPHSQGRGDASGIMKTLTDHADRRGIRLRLQPAAYGAGLNQGQLEGFYKKRGFVDEGKHEGYWSRHPKTLDSRLDAILFGATAKFYAENRSSYGKKLAYDKKLNARPDRKAYRRKLAVERRSQGIMGKGGKDVSHAKGGKFKLEDPSKNRARNGHGDNARLAS